MNKIISNFNESNLENKRIIMLDKIRLDAVISAHRSKNGTSIYDV